MRLSKKKVLGSKEEMLEINVIWWAVKGTIGPKKANDPFQTKCNSGFRLNRHLSKVLDQQCNAVNYTKARHTMHMKQ